jgi:uroporphyrinogen-III synthase
MAGTRSSSHNAGSSPAKSDDAVAGSKRKPEAEPSPNRSRKASKKQATLEESGITNEDSEMKDATNGGDEKESEPEAKDDAPKVQEDKKSTNDEKEASDNPVEVETTNDDLKGEANDDTAKPDAANGEGAIETSSQREKEVPSNILEKGLIYFFTRNRVGIDDAESVGDLQRTFFVLRPLPTGAKLGEGAIPDLENNRLFALPKKTLPKSHTDRFMAFVEKANTTIQDLKDNFCK